LRLCRRPAVSVSLPIVPMLDLSFQLLFFFIITFSPGKPEGQMALALPAVSGGPVAPQPAAPENIDFAADRTVSIRVADGVLRLTLIESDRLTAVSGVAELTEHLKANRDGAVRIRAEDQVRFAQVVAVVDAC